MRRTALTALVLQPHLVIMVIQAVDLVIVDEDLSAWTAGLDELFGRVTGRFHRVEPRRRGRAYVRGLPAPIAGKNGWTLAEVAGESTPDGMQRLLNAASWDADGVRDDPRAYVVEQLGDHDGVLVVDETGFLKKGDKSAGVQRQYSGTAGRVENCQLGVFLAYATSQDRTLIDREPYLPKSWTGDRARCREAAVPDTISFATKAAARMSSSPLTLRTASTCMDGVIGSHRVRPGVTLSVILWLSRVAGCGSPGLQPVIRCWSVCSPRTWLSATSGARGAFLGISPGGAWLARRTWASMAT